MHLALYQPEIPQNTGTLLRLGACLNVPIEIIEPCGFLFSDRRLARSGMDYLESVQYQRHDSWEHFRTWSKASEKRIVLLTPDAKTSFVDFSFQSNDVLLLGQESQGVPKKICDTLSHQVVIPMVARMRSLNLATAAAMVIGEGLRQIRGFPNDISGLSVDGSSETKSCEMV